MGNWDEKEVAKHFRKEKQHVPRPWRAGAGHGQQTQRGRGGTAQGKIRGEMEPGLVGFLRSRL